VADWNFTWSSALIDGLIAAGVHHFVVAPGAHAAPLIMACRTNPQARVTVIIDERSAAFFALGKARTLGQPVVIICTSGSAIGHLYPAIMEASSAMASLIILAADRPPDRQDCCAAQAIDQIKVFGSLVRAAHHLPTPDHTIDALASIAARIVEQSQYPAPGPVSVNQPFREPLYATTLTRFVPARQPTRLSQPVLRAADEDVQDMARRVSRKRGIILCGSQEMAPDAIEAIHRLARATGAPIIADPLSGLRFGLAADLAVLSHADSLLRAADFADVCRPDWILALGGPPMSPATQGWLRKCAAADFFVVDDGARWPDPSRLATRMIRSAASPLCNDLAACVQPGPADWTKAFLTLEGLGETAALMLARELLWEAPIIRLLLQRAPADGLVFSANSMSIRDFDSFSGTATKRLRLLANRGVNGIDGSIATLLGMASVSGLPTIGMIGDVAFAHDVGSLQIANDLDVLMIVVNNGGGAIFDYQGAAKTGQYHDFLCPPRIDIAGMARACGWHHRRASTLTEFETCLDEAWANGGCRILEATINRRSSVSRHHEFWRYVEEHAGLIVKNHGLL
jgi:2-succinyl-5-enolpyruvyl-6-hydroxy-3-cyclohexene-1-carboxylate synthase